jgi:hypothetical protein
MLLLQRVVLILKELAQVQRRKFPHCQLQYQKLLLELKILLLGKNSTIGDTRQRNYWERELLVEFTPLQMQTQTQSNIINS